MTSDHGIMDPLGRWTGEGSDCLQVGGTVSFRGVDSEPKALRTSLRKDPRLHPKSWTRRDTNPKRAPVRMDASPELASPAPP